MIPTYQFAIFYHAGCSSIIELCHLGTSSKDALDIRHSKWEAGCHPFTTSKLSFTWDIKYILIPIAFS